MKGIPNGVSHEKKGNKRAPADVRLVSKYVQVFLQKILKTKNAIFTNALFN